MAASFLNLPSREHLRSIVPVVREALQGAGMALRDLDAVGVTSGPGLVGALLVGVTYGKILALSLGIPLIAVNHLEGHVRSVFLEAYRAGQELKLPAVCLIVSGGHTVLYEVTPSGDAPAAEILFCYRRIGQTRDDAAGEAYDKVARLLALGYPGGPVIDQLAGGGRAPTEGGIRFGVTRVKGNAYDFSFSGIKTAVLYYLRAHPEWEPEIAARREALARGERKAAQLLPAIEPPDTGTARQFSKDRGCRAGWAHAARGRRNRCADRAGFGRGGGKQRVADYVFARGRDRGLQVCFPSRELSTDNAAMIAAAAYPKFLARNFADGTLNAEPVLPLA